MDLLVPLMLLDVLRPALLWREDCSDVRRERPERDPRADSCRSHSRAIAPGEHWKNSGFVWAVALAVVKLDFAIEARSDDGDK